ncbi:hypothetical protein Vretimale_17198 [Volvox reticuliferus]|uniref:PLA2c domain-containing protein n=1 Tax=Volvox reticuliferus TaxID=1737510 RepID=A0A8J4CTN2_9CHLO|nr:hypothetical protein Vretifemale_16647 [Volvox reticuliferus]GIM14315.1 hypothetical protein Vretimale_17198 [Volvox reticuliferus]
MGCGASRTVEQKPTQVGATATIAVEGKPTAIHDTSQVSTDVKNYVCTTLVKAWPANANGDVCFPEVDDPEFAIPALASDKLPLAICISGGGFRAATLGLGWLRALQILGVLKKAKYLCTCSGSSWLSSALCFQRLVSTEEFLGPYLSPEECSLEALNEVGQKGHSAAAVLADAEPLRDYFKDWAGGVLKSKEEAAKQARSWTKAIAASFLQPYGLGDTDTSTVTCCGTKGGVETTVSERASDVGRGRVLIANLDGLPFPIIVQVIMLATEKVKSFPLEWTPLYSGCPVLYTETKPKLGAGWVEALGVNAELVGKPEAVDGCPGAVRVRVRPAGPASLSEAIGISSAYIASQLELCKSKTDKAVHRALGFNTAQYFNLQDWSSSNVEVADGGGVDYYSIYPALRRKVPSIIVCSASRTEINDPNFSMYMLELAGLFGCWPGNPKDADVIPEEYNKLQQVFPSEGFSELCQALQDSAQAGLAPVHVNEYEVIENSALGVRGGWRVRVMWVMNDRQSAWEAALPEDTREQLDYDRNGLMAKVDEALNPLNADTLREFPHVSTFAMNYKPHLVNLMANHAAHMLMTSKSAVHGMVAAAAAAMAEETEPSADA